MKEEILSAYKKELMGYSEKAIKRMMDTCSELLDDFDRTELQLIRNVIKISDGRLVLDGALHFQMKYINDIHIYEVKIKSFEKEHQYLGVATNRSEAIERCKDFTYVLELIGYRVEMEGLE